ncbi:MAG: hypothetical protein ACYC3G_00510 [Minisyncoccota bacterium]
MKKIIISLIAVGLSFGMAANAQMKGGQGLGGSSAGVSQVQQQAQIHEPGTGLGTTSVEPLRTQVRENNEGVKTELKNTIEVEREKMAEVRNEIRDQVASGSAVSSEAVRAAVQKMQEERNSFRVRVESLKQEAKTKMAQEREALKVRLQVVKDEAKKATVQKLDENINNLNSNFVEKFTKNLTDFDTYLSKLVDKASATSTTKDLTAFNSAVGSAKAAIASAKAAVEAQTNKVYTIAVSSEANLKSDVSSVRGLLNNDLKSVRDLVQAAHSATVIALTEFNKIK